MLRVLTLNIWARSGPYETRERLLREGIRDLAPDLIALQEVDVAPDGRSQAHELFGPLGYEIDYERRDCENCGDPGIAVASRHPIEGRRVLELGHGGVALAVRIGLEPDPVWFCCALPLSWWPDREIEREDEVVALDQALAEIARDDLMPPILAGDFDATPDAASIRFLTGLQSLHGRSTYWADAFALAGDGTPGYTWSSDNPYCAPFAEAVFSQPVHHRRIDYVMVGSPFRWKARVVARSARVVLTGNAQEAPSDHYGVVADLDLDRVGLRAGLGLETWQEAHDALWPR